MIFSSRLRISIIFLSFLFLLSSINAVDVEVTINESSSLKQLLGGSYSLQSTGILEIYNPSNISKVYEITIPVELDSLIGISKVRIDNSSDFFDFSFDRIKGYLLQPNESVKVGYSFYGLLNYNIYDKLDNESIFEYYTDDFEMLSNTQLNVQKVEREGIDYNNTGDIESFVGENTTRRLISAGIRNPTDYTYTAKELRLYRSVAGDNQTYYTSGNLLKSFQNITISPFGYSEVDYFDPYSVNNSIYWLSSDIMINYKSIRNTSSSFSKQQSSGGGGGSGSSSEEQVIDDELLKDNLLIKKSTDKTIVTNGDEVKVSLTLVNAEESDVEDLIVVDELPPEYELKDVSNEVKISPGKLTFTIDELDRLSSTTLEYTLINNKQQNGVTYLQPAKMDYENTSYFSDGVLLINNLLPDKKVFVQKEVSLVDDDFSRVTIKVKNLGSISLEDLMVRDNIDEDSIVKDISEMFFEKGTWRVKVLQPGEEWEVTYLVERNAGVDSLPNVFGVEQENVYGTIISSGEVVTIFNEDSRTVEKVGLMLSVGLLIIYLLF